MGDWETGGTLVLIVVLLGRLIYTVMVIRRGRKMRFGMLWAEGWSRGPRGLTISAWDRRVVVRRLSDNQGLILDVMIMIWDLSFSTQEAKKAVHRCRETWYCFLVHKSPHPNIFLMKKFKHIRELKELYGEYLYTHHQGFTVISILLHLLFHVSVLLSITPFVHQSILFF